MDVLVIATNRNSSPVPIVPTGACIVAEAASRGGHRVRVLDLMFERNPVGVLKAELRHWKPDIIGLSVRNIDGNDMQNPVLHVQDLLPLVETIRGMTKATILLGGPAVAVMPEELMRYTGVSLAVLSDGETVFPELLRNLSNGSHLEEVPGVAWIEDGVFRRNQPPSQAFDGFTAPDFRRWIDTQAYLGQLATVPVQTKLGCHFKCVYCTYRKIEGHSYRCFPPEQVVQTVERLVGQGLRDIEFVDNVFNSPYSHAMAVCEALAEARTGARFQSLELNPYFIDDALFTAMEDAGFVSVGLTVESASDAVLTSLKKGFTAQDVHHAAEVVRRHGLPCMWIFLLGGPGETEETVMETLRFAEGSIRPQDVAFFNVGIRIYPGTELESLARQQGLLSLSPEEMLEPVFYISPEIRFDWLLKKVRSSVDTHLNFMNLDSIGTKCLPTIHCMGYKLGIRPPLWRYTRSIRRGLRFLGIE